MPILDPVVYNRRYSPEDNERESDPISMKFSQIAALVADMDGVLWRGDQALPGMYELFDWLRERQLPYMLATNNSTRTRTDYVVKLAKLGVPDVTEAHIITAAYATADYMQQHYPAGTRVYVVGMTGIRGALEAAGFDLDDHPTTADPVQVVVGSADFELTYDRLKIATLQLRAGADFIGTNGDLTFPSTEGLVPGAGTVLAALQAASGRTPTVIGKPNLPMYVTALRQLALPADRVLMVGDRLDTDIAGAKQIGMPTALVLTGVTGPDDLVNQPGEAVWADVAYDDLPALLRAWAGDAWYRAKLKAKRDSRA